MYAQLCCICHYRNRFLWLFMKWSESHSVVSNSLQPMDYTVLGILQARILVWVAFPFSKVSSQPRDQTRSPALQVDSLPTELSGKPRLFMKFNISSSLFNGRSSHSVISLFSVFSLLSISVLYFSHWFRRLLNYSIVEYYVPNKMMLKGFLMMSSITYGVKWKK